MTTIEERMKILDMIRDGKLTPEEGARLLQALQTGARQNPEGQRDPRWLRVRVTGLKDNKAKVNVSLPISLVNVGIKLGARFLPEGQVDFKAVLETIRSGRVGKVFEAEDAGEGERIEIWVE